MLTRELFAVANVVISRFRVRKKTTDMQEMIILEQSVIPDNAER